MKKFNIRFNYHCDEGFTTGNVTVKASDEEMARNEFNSTIAPVLSKQYGADVDIMEIKEIE
jgi:hypothetical protein